MGLFKIKNSRGEEPLKWIMNWLGEMKPRVSVKEKIPSEEGKQVGWVPWAFFSGLIVNVADLGEGDIST